MRAIGSTLFYSCRKAGELMEKRYEVPLSVVEKFRLRIHLSLCITCQRYEAQSRLLQEYLDQYRNPMIERTISESEIQELEQAIFRKLS